MEIQPQYFENSLEKKEVDVEFLFSVEREVFRIRCTLQKMDFYKTFKYVLHFPKQLESLLEKSEDVEDVVIKAILEQEYNEKEYEEVNEYIVTSWKEKGKVVMDKIKTLGRDVQSLYTISLTKYGVGGSYGLPNFVVLNFYLKSEESCFQTVKHEIIHLTIEDLIQKYHIDQKPKERIVDLTYNRFFENERGIQWPDEKMEEITDIFDIHFPNIETIISEIGKLEKYTKKKN